MTQIATGFSHCSVLSSKGFVYCWGSNHENQLGRMDDVYSSNPILITDKKIKNIKLIACSAFHTVAVRGISKF